MIPAYTLKCPLCGAPLLSTTLWDRSDDPKWRCGTFWIIELHQSVRCWWRTLFLRLKGRRAETYVEQQDRLLQEQMLEKARKELET